MLAADRMLSSQSPENSDRTSIYIQMAVIELVEVELDLPHLPIFLRYLQMPIVVVHALHRTLTELVQLRSAIWFGSFGEVWHQVSI